MDTQNTLVFQDVFSIMKSKSTKTVEDVVSILDTTLDADLGAYKSIFEKVL